MPRETSVPSIALAAGLALVAAGVWRWQGGIVGGARPTLKTDPWDHVKAHYPVPEEPGEPPGLSAAIVEAVTKANPFSPTRRQAPAPLTPAGGSGGAVAKPVTPKFRYKGRITLGTRVRAIVEDTSVGKTYFLEVGQAVAGFKVLDIAEHRVLLSDPQTDEEVTVLLASPATP